MFAIQLKLDPDKLKHSDKEGKAKRKGEEESVKAGKAAAKNDDS